MSSSANGASQSSSTGSIFPDFPPGTMRYSSRCLGCLADLEELDKLHRTVFKQCPACKEPRHAYHLRTDKASLSCPSDYISSLPAVGNTSPSQTTDIFASPPSQQSFIFGSSTLPNDAQRGTGPKTSSNPLSGDSSSLFPGAEQQTSSTKSPFSFSDPQPVNQPFSGSNATTKPSGNGPSATSNNPPANRMLTPEEVANLDATAAEADNLIKDLKDLCKGAGADTSQPLTTGTGNLPSPTSADAPQSSPANPANNSKRTSTRPSAVRPKPNPKKAPAQPRKKPPITSSTKRVQKPIHTPPSQPATDRRSRKYAYTSQATAQTPRLPSSTSERVGSAKRAKTTKHASVEEVKDEEFGGKRKG